MGCVEGVCGGVWGIVEGVWGIWSVEHIYSRLLNNKRDYKS